MELIMIQNQEQLQQDMGDSLDEQDEAIDIKNQNGYVSWPGTGNL